MGLDVYLNKCPDLALANAAEAAAEAESEVMWAEHGNYQDLTEAQKESLRAKDKEIRDKHGLVDYEHASVQSIRMDSPIDPEHLFKVGYLRSSYNDGGINNVLRNLGLPGLYEIFGRGEEGDYEFKPDWAASLERVNDTISRYAAHLASDAGRYLVSEIRPHWHHDRGVASEDEARKLAMEWISQSAERGADAYSFSNGDGHYFHRGCKMVALVTKKYVPPEESDVIGRIINTPGVFVVYEKEPDDKEDWYLTALKITRETIEYVLAQPDADQFYFHWSA